MQFTLLESYQQVEDDDKLINDISGSWRKEEI